MRGSFAESWKVNGGRQTKVYWYFISIFVSLLFYTAEFHISVNDKLHEESRIFLWTQFWPNFFFLLHMNVPKKVDFLDYSSTHFLKLFWWPGVVSFYYYGEYSPNISAESNNGFSLSAVMEISRERCRDDIYW